MAIPNYQISRVAYGILIRTLMGDPVSIEELVEATGLHKVTVREIINLWHDMGVIHRAEYSEDSMGRANVARYTLGGGEDARRWKPLTNTEKMRRKRAKKKQIKLNHLLAGRRDDVPKSEDDVYPVRV